MTETNKNNESKKQLNMTRIFNSTPEIVFKMWTDPEHVAKWWGPKGFTIPECKIDLRPGGKISLTMKGPDGSTRPNEMIIKEVDPPKKLVLTMEFMPDENGDPQGIMENIVTFVEYQGKTKMEFTVVEVKAMLGPRSALEGLEGAWGQSFDKLEDALINV
ncbi:MAG: hypothetical protein HeimC3_18810 [Candidatus Heimdallarchaeota archaeon LC_3]|nr:MAG: hypothetical protein HeimC3_18810 [Candidatus Heimdallarchaeota archaeon LC_3]